MGYIYRREDNGTTVEVDWQTMMGQEGPYITLSDGVLARRCVYLEQDGQPVETKERAQGPPPAIVSDTLGVPDHQVSEMRADAQKHGLAVDFTPDPAEPRFYQARFPSVNEWRRYISHRGLADKNGRNGGGGPLTLDMLNRAKARLLEQAETRR